MTAWKLFGDEPPETLAALRARGRMNLERQPGFGQRAAQVTGLVTLVTTFASGLATVTDLGCGDGAMLGMLKGLRCWGYEIGLGDVEAGQRAGRDVRRADILKDNLEYGDILIVSEVLEHLADPAAFLARLPDERLLIASSPSAETGDWHNPCHAWAWDRPGYRELIERAGWQVLYQAECDGGRNIFAGVEGVQRFQAVVAVRP